MQPEKVEKAEPDCKPLDLFCHLNRLSRGLNRSGVEPTFFLEAAVESIDHMLPVVGPVMDTPFVDAIEKNVVKNVVDAIKNVGNKDTK
jgi:hypothetical protein